MFIDDTGEVDNAATNDDRRRFASITGIIFEWGHYYHEYVPALFELRRKHFGLGKSGKPPILHRRSLIVGAGKFSVLKEDENRAKWNADCLNMYGQFSYTVITVCIDKVAFYFKHPNWREEVYLLLIQNAIERYYYFLASNNGIGDVLAESVGDKPDKALRARYQRVYLHGTPHISEQKLQSVLSSKEIKIKPKTDDLAGLQLADLIAKPSFDYCRLIYTNVGQQSEFTKSLSQILEHQKYYRQANRVDGRGRIWRPK